MGELNETRVQLDMVSSKLEQECASSNDLKITLSQKLQEIEELQTEQIRLVGLAADADNPSEIELDGSNQDTVDLQRRYGMLKSDNSKLEAKIASLETKYS